MEPLPGFGEIAKKYAGAGWGGFALYLFDTEQKIPKEMEEIHERKLEDELTKWEENYPKQTKYSASLLNDQKILNGLIKQEK